MSGNIYLYGPPGVGKSSVGVILAESLNIPFFDLDALIEKETGRTIPEIFESQSEASFRELESRLLGDTAQGSEGVISLGGGALLDADNRTLAESRGVVLLLHAGTDTLRQRLNAQPGQRPLLAGGGLEALIETRAAHYDSFPDQIDTAENSPEEVAWNTQIFLGRFYLGEPGQGSQVQIASGLLDSLGESLQHFPLISSFAVVTDQNVAGFWGQAVDAAFQQAGVDFQRITLPAGEETKDQKTLQQLWSNFLEFGLDRGSAVVALGGGVVSDLAGFAAATYMRGIPWIVLPTTLLSMVDASLGGKTGINLPEGKNLAGAFHQPQAVWTDTFTLTTLPEAELRSGMAEVIKHGVIDSPALFARCAQGWPQDDAEWLGLVRLAAAVKVKIVQQDPLEKGLRAVLNLGHTIGHAVEAASKFKLKHGEAIAIGLVAEARIAERISLASSGLADEIEDVLRKFDLPTQIPDNISMAEVLDRIAYDKKKKDGKVRYALPVEIGRVEYGVVVDDVAKLIR